MRIHVVLFAGLAAALGTREEAIELNGEPTAGDVFRHYRQKAPQMGELGTAVMLAVNEEFCGAEVKLREGDEVALLPPMSGGSPAAIETGLVREVLPAVPEWAGGGFGAVVNFEGVVRNHTTAAPGREVVALEYEAYEPMAERRMAAIAVEAVARWPLTHISLLHRLGRLAVGEVSVRVVVAAAHRGDAFAACRFAIDTLKRSVPIWKKEVFNDGSAWADGDFPENR